MSTGYIIQNATMLTLGDDITGLIGTIDNVVFTFDIRYSAGSREITWNIFRGTAIFQTAAVKAKHLFVHHNVQVHIPRCVYTRLGTYRGAVDRIDLSRREYPGISGLPRIMP